MAELRSEPARGALRRNAPALFAFFLTAIVLFRAGSLLRHRRVLTTPPERRFFGWPYYSEGFAFAREIGSVAPQLRDGEAVCVLRSPGPYRRPPAPGPWPAEMAVYFLPRQVVVAPRDFSQPRGPACARTTLSYGLDRPLTLHRSEDGGTSR